MNEKTITNLLDLKKAIKGRANTTLYTRGLINIDDDTYSELKARNIQLQAYGEMEEEL